ncbi:hypothetical protein L3X38_026962 [Prunus dulcis]|uniref:Uncharacterized protein n=1 Tax=Prunus dulcis TaxID=3755 RepID=A0AAD4VMY4_PRUDU|nr:hypothetical protein L3X38_026962 [Prunus dulcis]
MVIPESAMSDDCCISASAEVRLPDSDLGTQMRIGFPRERSIAEISSFRAFVEAFYLFSQSRVCHVIFNNKRHNKSSAAFSSLFTHLPQIHRPRRGKGTYASKKERQKEKSAFHHRELSLRDSYSNQLSTATSFYSRTKKGSINLGVKGTKQTLVKF